MIWPSGLGSWRTTPTCPTRASTPVRARRRTTGSDARTAYSKSSWQRYLNATQPPPRQAVVALCRVAGIDKGEAERFGVRWELAVQAWPKPVTVPERPEGAAPVVGGAETEGEEYEDDPTLPWWDAPPKTSGPPSRRLLMVAVVLAVLLVLAVVIGAVALG